MFEEAVRILFHILKMFLNMSFIWYLRNNCLGPGIINILKAVDTFKYNAVLLFSRQNNIFMQTVIFVYEKPFKV